MPKQPVNDEETVEKNEEIVEENEEIVEEEQEDQLEEDNKYNRIGDVYYPADGPISKETQYRIIEEIQSLNDLAVRRAKEMSSYKGTNVAPQTIDVRDYFTDRQILDLSFTMLEGLSNSEKVERAKGEFRESMTVAKGYSTTFYSNEEDALQESAFTYKLLRAEYNKLGFFRFFKSPSMYFALRSMKNELLETGKITAEQLKEFEHDDKTKIQLVSKEVTKEETEIMQDAVAAMDEVSNPERKPVPEIEKDINEDLASDNNAVDNERNDLNEEKVRR